MTQRTVELVDAAEHIRQQMAPRINELMGIAADIHNLDSTEYVRVYITMFSMSISHFVTAPVFSKAAKLSMLDYVITALKRQYDQIEKDG